LKCLSLTGFPVCPQFFRPRKEAVAFPSPETAFLNYFFPALSSRSARLPDLFLQSFCSSSRLDMISALYADFHRLHPDKPRPCWTVSDLVSSGVGVSVLPPQWRSPDRFIPNQKQFFSSANAPSPFSHIKFYDFP